MSISRHTGLNLSFNVLSLSVYLVTVPLYLASLGLEEFGLLTLVWLLVTYSRLFDLGLSRAVAQRVAAISSSPSGTIDGAATILWTALVLGIVGGAGAALALYLVSDPALARWSTLSAESRLALVGTVPWLVAVVPLVTGSATLLGALQGRQRFLEMNVAILTGLVLTQVAPLAMIKTFGGGLELVVPTIVVARAASLFLLVYICRSAGLLILPARFSASEARRILRYGGWVGVTSVVSPLMTALDRFVIAASSGPQAVPLCRRLPAHRALARTASKPFRSAVPALRQLDG